MIDVKWISETLTGNKVGDKVGANVGLRVGDCYVCNMSEAD